MRKSCLQFCENQIHQLKVPIDSILISIIRVKKSAKPDNRYQNNKPICDIKNQTIYKDHHLKILSNKFYIYIFKCFIAHKNIGKNGNIGYSLFMDTTITRNSFLMGDKISIINESFIQIIFCFSSFSTLNSISHSIYSYT